MMLSNPLKWFKSKLPGAASGNLIIAEPTILKVGKWVKHSSGVGICTDLSGAGYAVVHLVNALGETYQSVRIPIGELMLCKHLEIPECRRHPDPATAASLGYL